MDSETGLDPSQFDALAQLGFTPRDLSRMSVVAVYDRVVESLRTCPTKRASKLAERLFGPGSWEYFSEEFLEECQ